MEVLQSFLGNLKIGLHQSTVTTYTLQIILIYRSPNISKHFNCI